MIGRIIQYGRSHPLVRRYPILLQLFKFAVVGVFNFILDFSIYWYLTRMSEFMNRNYIFAHALSFLVAVTSSFFMNRKWTFRSVGTGFGKQQYIKFFTVSAGGLVLSSVSLYFVVSLVRLNDLLGKFLIAVIVMFWNFSMNKLWTFRKTTYETERSNTSI